MLEGTHHNDGFAQLVVAARPSCSLDNRARVSREQENARKGATFGDCHVLGGQKGRQLKVEALLEQYMQEYER